MSKVKWCLGFMAGLMLCASCSSSKTEVTPEAPVQEVTVASPYAEALDLFYAHRYKESAESATRVLDAQGNSLEGLTIRGLAYAKANLPKYAIVDLLKAVKMEYSVETLVNLGNALRSFGFCARAVDAYQHALSLDPGNPYILINLTSSYLCLEEVDMADATFVKVIPNLPQDAVAFTNAAILKDMQQDIPEALKAAKIAVQYDALYRPAYKVLSRALYASGDRQAGAEADKQYTQLKGQIRRTVRIPRRSPQ